MNVLFFFMFSPVSSSFCNNCYDPFPVGPLCSGRKSEPCLICRQHRLSGGVVGEVGVEGSFQGETSQVLQDCGLMICSCLFSRCVSTTMIYDDHDISWWSRGPGEWWFFVLTFIACSHQVKKILPFEGQFTLGIAIEEEQVPRWRVLELLLQRCGYMAFLYKCFKCWS